MMLLHMDGGLLLQDVGVHKQPFYDTQYLTIPLSSRDMPWVSKGGLFGL